VPRPSAATISAAERPESEHGGENLFADGSCDFRGLDEHYQFSESGWRDGAGGNFFAGIFQAAKKLGLHPVGCGFARSAGFDDGFKIIGQGLRVGQDLGVVRRDAVGGDEPGALGSGSSGGCGGLLRARRS